MNCDTVGERSRSSSPTTGWGTGSNTVQRGSPWGSKLSPGGWGTSPTLLRRPTNGGGTGRGPWRTTAQGTQGETQRDTGTLPGRSSILLSPSAPPYSSSSSPSSSGSVVEGGRPDGIGLRRTTPPSSAGSTGSGRRSTGSLCRGSTPTSLPSVTARSGCSLVGEGRESQIAPRRTTPPGRVAGTWRKLPPETPSSCEH